MRLGDMRAAHIRIAIKLMNMYTNFRIGVKLKKYGDNADILKTAFEEYKSGTLGFGIQTSLSF